MKSPEGPLSARELEGEDYPMDGMAPDDLPVRDIRGDEEDWRSPDEAGAGALGKPNQDWPDAQALGADRSEYVDAPTGLAASAPTPDDRARVPEARVPEQQAETDNAELPAQPLLPGLEPGPDDAPQRLRRPKRPRGSSDKHAVKMAQIELWTQPEGSDPVA